MEITREKILTILKNIKEIFINEDNYVLKKSVEEVEDNNGFLGDFVSFLMVDKNVTPPKFYSVTSPYDIVSKKDPQHALVWQDGNLLVNTDYTEYASLRTGAMDSIVLELLGTKSLNDKKILMYGVGKTAKWSLKILKSKYQDLSEIYYINSDNSVSDSFEKFADNLAVSAYIGKKDKIEDFDIIICHTNTNNPVLVDSDIARLKDGAIITSYLGSEKKHGEVDSSFYNNDANIIIDWKENVKKANDIINSNLPKNSVLSLRDLLDNSIKIDKSKKYSIFRFVGTPMQNLAVLKTLSEGN